MFSPSSRTPAYKIDLISIYFIYRITIEIETQTTTIRTTAKVFFTFIIHTINHQAKPVTCATIVEVKQLKIEETTVVKAMPVENLVKTQQLANEQLMQEKLKKPLTLLNSRLRKKLWKGNESKRHESSIACIKKSFVKKN